MSLAQAFQFRLQTNLQFGPGALASILGYIEENRCGRVGVVIDANVERSDYWRSFQRQLAEVSVVEPYFGNQKMEPTYDYLDAIRMQFAADLDLLIGVGGGSTMDIAKAVSVLATNPEPAIRYRGFGMIREKGIPLVLAPSTAGSGSEITPFAVFIDTSEQRKFGINSPLYLPVMAVIDPLLTVSCPRSVTVASGVDALTHTLESYVARKQTPISRFFSAEAFRLIYNNLPRVVEDPANVDLRTAVSLGAFYAGIALFNAAAGPAGVLSYPIGTLFGVTHGLAGAVFLPPVVEFNVRNGYQDYARLYDLIEPEFRQSDSGADDSERFADNFRRFCSHMAIPTGLEAFGVTRSDVPRIMAHLRLLWSAVEQNPVAMTEGDVEAILHGMLA